VTRRLSITVPPPWPALVAPLVRWIIYALIDPRYNTVRYIGKSSRGLDRPYEHAKLAATRDPRYDLKYCYRWVRSLQRLGLEYEVIVLEEVDCSDWLNVHEKWWIAFARAWDCRLTNLTDGGEGMLGYRHTQATRTKMSASAIVIGARPDVKAKRSAAARAACARPEVKVKRSVAQCATWARPEVKVKRCAAIRVALAQPKEKVRRSTAARAACARPEVKARKNAANVRAGRVRASIYRRLIVAMPDAANAQIYAAVVAELGADRAGPLGYVTWYRRQLRCESPSFDAHEAMNAQCSHRDGKSL